MRWLLGVLGATVVVSSLGSAAVVRAAGGPSSNPGALVRVGDTVFFGANDGSHGSELWKSDGTPEGTALVKDILPGTEGSRPAGLIRVGSDFYFSADDGVHGFELWKSDGTEAGTAMVKDITPGPGYTGLGSVHAAMGSELFFAVHGTDGASLWKSDGSDAGTVKVKSIGLGVARTIVVGSTLFFFAYDGAHGWELWKSDGTPGGTSVVKNLNPGADDGVVPFDLTRWGSKVYFTGDDGVHGFELWTSDGTASGTHMVRNINPGARNSYPTALAPFGTLLLFAADDGAHDQELWKTDGSRAATVMLKDLTPAGRRRSRIGSIVRLGKLALFNALDEGSLFRTNGTAKGTVIVRRPRDGGPGAIFGAGMRRVLGIGVLFEAYNALWKSNGWRNATVQIIGFKPGHITALGYRRALFAADDGVHGEELWTTDGTTGGTHLVKDINP